MNIGNIIKQRRKQLNITQKELSEGICTQAMISKIEKNELNPSINIMHQIADKLHVPLDYFFKKSETPEATNTHLDIIIGAIRNHLDRREYSLIAKIMKDNEKFINKNDGNDNQYFFEWIEGILYYYLDKNFSKSIDILSQIDLDPADINTSIEILNSIGIIYYEESDYETAQSYFNRAISSVNETASHTIKVKLYFSASLCLKKTGNTEEAIQLIIKAINDSIDANSMYALGELYYQKALCMELLDDIHQAMEDLKIAIALFKLQKFESFEVKAKLKLKNLKELKD